MGTYYYRIYSNNANNYSVSLFRTATTGFTGALHYWNFNQNVPDAQGQWDTVIPAFSGSGILTHSMADVRAFQGSILNTLPNDEAGSSFAPRGLNNNDRELILFVPSVNKKDIVFSYAARGTATGYNRHTIFYTTDGMLYDSLISFQNVDYDWTVRHIDFSGMPAVNDNPDFSIKILISGATHSLGNNRFDNFMVVGNDLDFSVSDILRDIRIAAYPNPFSDMILITDNIENGHTYSLSLHDIKGKLLYEAIEQMPAHISSSHLCKGIYILKIVGNDGAVFKKLIKL